MKEYKKNTSLDLMRLLLTTDAVLSVAVLVYPNRENALHDLLKECLNGDADENGVAYVPAELMTAAVLDGKVADACKTMLETFGIAYKGLTGEDFSTPLGEESTYESNADMTFRLLNMFRLVWEFVGFDYTDGEPMCICVTGDLYALVDAIYAD